MESLRRLLFEAVLAFIPYLGWGVVILTVMFVLDVILTAEKDHGFDDLLRHGRKIIKELETFKVRCSASKACIRIFCCLCLYPILVIWWFKIIYYNEETFVERLFSRTKKKIEEKKKEGLVPP